MAGKTSIFVSSACYEFRSDRSRIKESIDALGHDSILSEFADFPVPPTDKSFERCIYDIENLTDFYILIIGKERGSVDPITRKSFVELEYQAAANKNIDMLIFVKKNILQAFDDWLLDPTKDYSAIVGTTLIFEFIQELRAEKNIERYTLPFDTSDDLIQSIHHQLSVQFKYLLNRKKENALVPILQFQNESQRSRELALSKSENWQYYLRLELLRSRFDSLKEKFTDLSRGATFHFSKTMTFNEYSVWMETMVGFDFLNLLHILGVVCNDAISLDIGKKLEDDPLETRNKVEKMFEVFNKLYDWTVQSKYIRIKAPDEFQELSEILYNMGLELFNNFHEAIIDGLEKALSGDLASKAGSTQLISVTLTTESTKKYFEALSRLSNKYPEVLLE